MELRIPVADLSRALSMMQGIVQRKNTMPILANVLLEVTTTSEGEGRLTLSATDLDGLLEAQTVPPEAQPDLSQDVDRDDHGGHV